MHLRRLVLVLVVVAAAGTACSDDADAPAEATGTREAFCTELRAAIEGDLTVFDPLQPAGPDDTAAATERLADAAPAEVAAEMRLLADTFAAVATVLDRYQLIRVPMDVYQIAYVPFVIEGADLAVVVAMALVICFVATIYPSRQAARLDPVDALRFG